MITKVRISSFSTSGTLGYINILEAGAVADGATDNTAILIAALATGKPVYVPPGTYVTGPVSVPANGVLFGYGTLKLKAASTSSLLTLGSGSKVRQLSLDGNKSGISTVGCHAIAIVAGTNISIVDVKISNSYSDGVSITGASSNIRISNLDISGYARNGITWAEGTDVTIMGVICRDSDAAAIPGDGIAVASLGSAVSSGKIIGCTSRNNSGRGIVISGNGSKNVTNIIVSDCVTNSNVGSGIHVLTAERIGISNCMSASNTVDGIRLEGDVQNSRIGQCFASGNISYGIREVTTGTAPNLNTFHYCVTASNGNNTITKVGAGSVIV